jgi:F0F1-type ATP synthase membrane subunit b/b'
MRRKLFWQAVALATVLAAPALAFAEEEGFFKEHSLAIQTIVGAINFLIFFVILLKYAGPGIKAYFANNAVEYRARVEEAAKVLADAKAVHEEWTRRNSELAATADRLKTDAVKLAEAQSVQILANAQKAADRIVSEAHRTAEAELLNAKSQLQAQLVDDLLAKTEEKLRDRLTPSHQHVLIEEAIKKLEASQ